MRLDLTKPTFSAVLLVFAAAATALSDDGPQPACPLVPVPKSYRDHGRTGQLLGPDQAAIVLGPQASQPERYAAERLQTHVAQADTAAAFDDALSELKGLFEMPVRHYPPNKGWPPRLRRVGDRPRALALLDRLESLRAVLQERAPAETLLDSVRLHTVYLEPMQATLAYARKMAQLDYPEYTLGTSMEEKVIELYEDGGPAEAEKLVAAVRGQVQTQLAAEGEALRGLKGVDQYVGIIDRRPVHSYGSVTFLGPLRLRGTDCIAGVEGVGSRFRPNAQPDRETYDRKRLPAPLGVFIGRGEHRSSVIGASPVFVAVCGLL